MIFGSREQTQIHVQNAHIKYDRINNVKITEKGLKRGDRNHR